MVDKDNTIYFYDYESELTKKEHIYLNNFALSPLVDPATNSYYLTVEHYYQANKFDNFALHEEFKEAFEKIRNAPDADKCKKAAREYEKKFDGVWEKEKWHASYKDFIMRKALIYKFSQNVDLLKQLLETGNKRLVEESYKDPYWGGMLPDSKNKLGDFLAELRDNYNQTKTLYLSGTNIDPIKVDL